jgi:predicted negative regulator of RcsB-dependent stress response
VAFDLEEQEKLAELRAWWDKFGNLITTVIVIGALVVLGFNGYNAYMQRQADQAAVLFEQMQKAITAKNDVLIKETSSKLMSDYSRTAYAQMAALLVAHADVDAKDLKGAVVPLQWAIDHAIDDQYRMLARLRLATVQSDMGQPDAALASLDVKVPDQFASAFADRRGDIYLAQNRVADARAQYQLALDHLDAVGSDLQTAFTNVEKLKLDALASDTSGPATVAAAAPISPAASIPAAASATPAVTPPNPAPEKK